MWVEMVAKNGIWKPCKGGWKMKKKIKLGDLIPDDVNANKGNPRGLAAVESSLQKYGAARSVVLDKDNRILAGNKTWEAAGAIGLENVQIVETTGDTLVAVKRLDISIDSPRGRALAIADNRAGEVGLTWDGENLAHLSTQVDLLEFWTPGELEALNLPDLSAEDVEEGEGVDADETPEPEAEAVTKPGDLWLLGDHRVKCGDSTDPETTEALMDGERAALVFTDPPYDLAGSGSNFVSADLRKSYGDLYSADWDKGFDIGKLSAVLPLVMAPDASAYVTTSHFYLPTLIPMFAEIFDYSNVCVWAKSNPMPSLAKRHWTWCHEFAMYGTRGRHTFNFPAQGNALSVWDIAKNPKNEHHPTQKPVAVPAHAIRHSSKPGDLVVDLFLGSGTTIIAAEEEGRACYGVELSPAYVDVIVRRWQAFTGREALHVDGETFEATAAARLS